jgi:hypothetical protein
VGGEGYEKKSVRRNLCGDSVEEKPVRRKL